MASRPTAETTTNPSPPLVSSSTSRHLGPCLEGEGGPSGRSKGLNAFLLPSEVGGGLFWSVPRGGILAAPGPERLGDDPDYLEGKVDAGMVERV
jgi:hypothetical protein